MNTALNPTQGNTNPGDIHPLAGEDLTGKEGFLCKLASSGGKAVALLPTALADAAIYMINRGGASGTRITVEAVQPDSNFRVPAKGAGSAGGLLSLADPAVAADKGKLRALPGTTGTFVALAIAEEDFVDGQLVLARPFIRTVINP